MTEYIFRVTIEKPFRTEQEKLGDPMPPSEESDKNNSSSADRKKLTKDLVKQERSYRNSYIIAGIFIVFMIVMTALSFSPRKEALPPDIFYLSDEPVILEDITVVKMPLSVDIPVKLTVELERTDLNSSNIADIYFLEKDLALELRDKAGLLAENAIYYEKDSDGISFWTELAPETGYVFVVVGPPDTREYELKVRYDIRSYPFRPYLPLFIVFGVLGCVVPFVYIQLSSKKKKDLKTELLKEKVKRRREAEKARKEKKELPPRDEPPLPQPPPPKDIDGPYHSPKPPLRRSVPYDPGSGRYPQRVDLGATGYYRQQLRVLERQETIIRRQLDLRGSAEDKRFLRQRYRQLREQKRALMEKIGNG